MRPKHAAREFAPEPRPRCPRRRWGSPNPDAIVRPRVHRPSDRARPNDDNPAVLAPMRANARGMCVRRDDDVSERIGIRAHCLELDRLGRAGQGKAGDDGLAVEGELGLRQALPARVEHLLDGVVQSEADVGRACNGFTKDATRVAEAGATRAAAIDPQKSSASYNCDPCPHAHVWMSAANSNRGSLLLLGPMETERISPRIFRIDVWDPADVLDAMIEGQFAAVAGAVRAVRPALERAALAMEIRLAQRGR